MQQLLGDKGDNQIFGRSHEYEQGESGERAEQDKLQGQIAEELSPPLFGKYDIHFRDKDGGYTTLYRVAQLILPGSLYLTWKAFIDFQVDHLPPYVTLKHMAEYTKRNLRTVELNVQRLRQAGYASTAHAFRDGRWVVEKCFDGLYEVVVEYLAWEQSPAYIPPIREYFAVDRLDWTICQPLLRFNNYRRLIRNKKPGPKPKKAYVEEKECVDGVFGEAQIEPARSPLPDPREETAHISKPLPVSPQENSSHQREKKNERTPDKEAFEHRAQELSPEEVYYQEQAQQAICTQNQEQVQQSQNGQRRVREQRREQARYEPQREPQQSRVDHASQEEDPPQVVEWNKIPGLFMSPQLANSGPKKQAEPAARQPRQEMSHQHGSDEQIDYVEESYEESCEEEDYPENGDQQEILSYESTSEVAQWRSTAHHEQAEAEEVQIVDVDVPDQQEAAEPRSVVVFPTLRPRWQASARVIRRAKRISALWSSPEVKEISAMIQKMNRVRNGLMDEIEKVERNLEELLLAQERWEEFWQDYKETRSEQARAADRAFYEKYGYRRYKGPKPWELRISQRPRLTGPREERQGKVVAIEECEPGTIGEYQELQLHNQQEKQEELHCKEGEVEYWDERSEDAVYREEEGTEEDAVYREEEGTEEDAVYREEEGTEEDAVYREEEEGEFVDSASFVAQQQLPPPISSISQSPIVIVSSEAQAPRHDESSNEPFYTQESQQVFQEDERPEGYKLLGHERMRNIVERTAHLVVSSKPLGSHIHFEEIKVVSGSISEQTVSEQSVSPQDVIIVEGEICSEVEDEKRPQRTQGKGKERKVQERERKNVEKEARREEERRSEERVSQEKETKAVVPQGPQGVYTVSENGELKGFLFDVTSPDAWMQAWKEHPEMVAQAQNAMMVASAAKAGADDAEREKRGEPPNWSDTGSTAAREVLRQANRGESSTPEAAPTEEGPRPDSHTLAAMFIQGYMRQRQQEKQQAYEEERELRRKERHTREDEQARQAKEQADAQKSPSTDMKPLPPGVRDLGNGLIAVPITKEKEVVIMREDISTEEFFRQFTGGAPRRKSVQAVRDPRFVEDENRPRNTGPVSVAFKKLYLENQAKQLEEAKSREIILYDASRDPNSAFYAADQEQKKKWRPGDGFVSRGYIELRKKMAAERESQQREDMMSDGADNDDDESNSDMMA